MKKQTLPWLFAVIILSFFLVVSIVLGVTGYYFSVTYMHSNADIKVGDYIAVGVMPNQASVVSLNFDGGYLPNEVLPQVVQINAENLSVDLKVRVKAVVFGVESGEGVFDFITTEHFEKMSDGYYYFDEDLKAGNKITFCNYMIMPKEEKFLSSEKYILTIVVEAIEADLQNVW